MSVGDELYSRSGIDISSISVFTISSAVWLNVLDSGQILVVTTQRYHKTEYKTAGSTPVRTSLGLRIDILLPGWTEVMALSVFHNSTPLTRVTRLPMIKSPFANSTSTVCFNVPESAVKACPGMGRGVITSFLLALVLSSCVR
jgi:hypothetical protein